MSLRRGIFEEAFCAIACSRADVGCRSDEVCCRLDFPIVGSKLLEFVMCCVLMQLVCCIHTAAVSACGDLLESVVGLSWSICVVERCDWLQGCECARFEHSGLLFAHVCAGMTFMGEVTLVH